MGPWGLLVIEVPLCSKADEDEATSIMANQRRTHPALKLFAARRTLPAEVQTSASIPAPGLNRLERTMHRHTRRHAVHHSHIRSRSTGNRATCRWSALECRQLPMDMRPKWVRNK